MQVAFETIAKLDWPAKISVPGEGNELSVSCLSPNKSLKVKKHPFYMRRSGEFNGLILRMRRKYLIAHTSKELS